MHSLPPTRFREHLIKKGSRMSKAEDGWRTVNHCRHDMAILFLSS